MHLISSLVVGGLSGWIAGKIMDKKGGLLRNIILGILGGIVGGIVLGIIGISGHGFIGNMIVSVVGACILIFGCNAITK